MKRIVLQITAIILILQLYVFTVASEKDEHQSESAWVELSFDISKKGIPTNIRVIDSNTDIREIKQYAKTTLRKWKYKPKMVEGKPVVQKNQKVRLEFNL